MPRLTDKELLNDPAPGDLVHVVDVSDTTDHPDGTSKRVTLSSIFSMFTGSSVTIAEPTGDIDGVNVTFTVPAIPKWIVSDGIINFEGAGYTRTGLTITMDVPPSQFIRSVS